MSDFDTRPKGTVMYGAFNTFAPAERALRVLKNAGYARAAFENADEGESTEAAESIVVVVDAAKTGAARAAEILEEFGAQIYSTPPRALAPDAPVAKAAFVESPELTIFAESAVFAEQGVFTDVAIVPERTATLEPEQTASIEAAVAAPLHVTSSLERKPRVRKRRRGEIPRPISQPVANEPPEREVIIVTRAIESFASDG